MIRVWCSFGTYSVLILTWGLGPNLVLDTDYIDILCETRWVVKGNPKGCRVPKLMESVVFQDFRIYHFLHCKMKTHQLVVTFFDEICSKKN